MNKKCGLLIDDRYFNHDIALPSPENPQRLRSLYSRILSGYRDRFHFFLPRPAGLEDIVAVHSSFYLEQLWQHAEKDDPFSYDKDTYLMKDSFATAQLAAGGCLEMADAVMAGEIDCGFAVIRPPGHHAEPGRGMGFCILNNIGITAKYLQEHYNLSRILILDFDVHHGNGTQEMFYESDQVLVISLHQQGLFPFSGTTEEIGKGQGEGYNINIPVFAQFGDQEYTFLVGRLLQGIVEQFMPQIILVSAGYDGHKDDSISSTLLTTGWFATITTMLKQYAHDCCNNQLLFILEGGYNPVSLESSVIATLDSLLAPDVRRIGVLYASRAGNLLINHPLQRFWTLQ
jgi:acetoin utilization deacetylase AcuC-like enzyme